MSTSSWAVLIARYPPTPGRCTCGMKRSRSATGSRATPPPSAGLAPRPCSSSSLACSGRSGIGTADGSFRRDSLQEDLAGTDSVDTISVEGAPAALENRHDRPPRRPGCLHADCPGPTLLGTFAVDQVNPRRVQAGLLARKLRLHPLRLRH